MKSIKEIGIVKVLKFISFSILMFICKLMIFPPMRKIFLIILGVRIGRNTVINEIRFINLYRKGFKGLIIGNNCFIGDEVMLDLADSIIIEDDVTIAIRTTILTHLNVGYRDHPLQKNFPAYSKPVIIKKGSFIGAGVLLLPGITIEERAFVAAGSVVVDNVKSRTVVAGNPAKLIKTF